MVILMNINTVILILSSIIAVITVSILVLQYLLTKQRWRLDLYDKRIAVYIVVMKYIGNIVGNANLTHQDNMEFLRKTHEIDFLFKDDIQKFLKELYKKGSSLILTHKLMEKPKDEAQRLKSIDEEIELLEWFSSQFEESRRLFNKYLSITKR